MIYILKHEGQNFEIDLNKLGEKVSIKSPWGDTLWQVIALEEQYYRVIGQTRVYDVRWFVKEGEVEFYINQKRVMAQIQTRDQFNRSKAKSQVSSEKRVVSQMPGRVIQILKETGDAVKSGDGLLVIEAMKMQNIVRAKSDGIINKIYVKENQTIESKTLLIEFCE